jgi:ABC-type glycerol-3-phosphate transport system substrate-binding protein
MKKLRFLVVAVILIMLTGILIMSSVSCSNRTESGQTEEMPVLRLYLLTYYDTRDGINHDRGGRYNIYGRGDKYNFMYDMIDEYKVRVNEAKIEIIHFNNHDDLRTRMTVEIISGGGPDIVMIDPRYFPSMNKIPDGVFCDLNEFILQDENFNIEDYYTAILDSGIVRGKRYLAPVAYSVPVIYTSKEILEEYNINLDKPGLTWRELAYNIKEFIRETEDRKIYFFDWNFDFSVLLKTSGLTFIDYERKEARFDSSEFIELLRIYKDIHPSICPISVKEAYYYDAFWLMNEKSAVTNTKMLGLIPMDLSRFHASLKSELDEELVICPFPTYSGETNIYSESEMLLGINNNCKHKSEAYGFVKMVLSIQGDGYEINFLDGLPVNRKVYSEWLNTTTDAHEMEDEKAAQGIVSSDTWSIGFGTRYVTGNRHFLSPTDLFDKAAELMSSIHRCEIFDYDLYRLIEEELPLMLSGARDAEYTANVIQDKVTIYLHE